MMEKRKEVLDYIHKVGMKSSLKIFFLLLICAVIIVAAMDEFVQLLFLVPIIFFAVSLTHFIMRKHLENTMYNYYAQLYDLKMRIRKELKKEGLL